MDSPDKFRKSDADEHQLKTGSVQKKPRPWEVGYIILNRYEILDIKKGGMGVVYIAHDHEWNCTIAIKTFQDTFLGNEKIIRRFWSEAEIWIDLERHTNLVFANFVQVIEGKPLIFLEYIDSGDLNHFIGKLSIVNTLDFAIQFCSGMEYACRKLGVIHRDIKPGNVMVQKDSRFRSGCCYKITDFGLVKALGAEFDTTFVEVSTVLGTTAFMSPEQFPDRIQKLFSYTGKVTTKSDIYSFGITLYQLLTGNLPFSDLNRIFMQYPVHPKITDPKIPEDLDLLVIRCLEKNPDKRYRDFTELKEELVRIFNRVTGESYVELGRKEELTYSDLSNKGLALSVLGRQQDAIELFNKALELNPQYAVIWYNKGTTLANLGNHQDALVCYDKAIEIHQNNAHFWYNKGNSLSFLGNHQDAVRCFAKALELNPTDAEAWYNKGNSLSHLGKDLDALGCFDKALEINPESEEMWNKKGNLLSHLGKHKDALECYDKALKLNQKKSFTWYNKGVVLSRLGNHTDAIACYTKAIEINPDYADAWNNKGFSFIDLGRHQDAIACYTRALEINPNFGEAWNNKGNALSEIGKDEEAIPCLDKALGINMENAEAWNNKGLAYLHLGHYYESIKYFDKALGLKPGFKEAWSNKGLAYLQLEKYQDAIRCYDIALDLNPKVSEDWSNEGVAFANLGRLEDAVRCYNKAIELDQTNAGLWFNKAFALIDLGRTVEAIQCLETFIKLAPPQHATLIEEAKQMIKQLRGR